MASEVPEALREALSCLHSTEAIVAVYDREDILRYANTSYERRFLRGLAMPVSFPDVLRHGFENHFGVYVTSGDIEAFIASILTRRRGAPFRAFEVDTVDNEWLWMTETMNQSGWMLSVGSVITRLKDHERLLQRDRDHARLVADTDGLTGLANRRSILELAEATLVSCQRTETPCSFVLVDLDHFKAVNDTFGHLAGDDLLAHFASYCRKGLRQHDRLGRYGGEEFLVVLPETCAAEAMHVIERIRERMPPMQLLDGAPHRYTFSAGIAEANAADSLSSVLIRADVALYRGKANGRNRTEAAPSLRGDR